MRGRRSFTFEYEGTFHNPRFHEAKVKFSIKLINAPRMAAIGGQGYQQYRVRNTTNDGWVDSPYGPITQPNWLPEFFFEKATIEVLGGTEIEPGTQTHQVIKLVNFHTKMKPEEAAFKYSNLGGYYEEYDRSKIRSTHSIECSHRSHQISSRKKLQTDDTNPIQSW